MRRMPTLLATVTQQSQLLGQRARLQRELACAFSAQPLSRAMIERIVGDFARVEDDLAGSRWYRSRENALQETAQA
jgi:hypothetical protein